MKINKKGFTLIELLAVIVVLAIILTITIPAITGSLNESKKNVAKIQAQKAIKAMKECYLSESMKSGSNAIIECTNPSLTLGDFLDKSIDYRGGSISDYDNMSASVVANGEISGYKISTDSNDNNIEYYTIKNGSNGLSISNGVLNSNHDPRNTFSIKNIIIPEGITEINYAVFQDLGITSVIFPKSLKIIRDDAFTNNSLENIIIPNGVTTIATGVFVNNNLKNLVIPNTVTSIGHGAFSNNQLNTVIIPSSVTEIGVSVFYRNPLSSIIFEGRSNLEGISLGDGWSGSCINDCIKFRP